MYPDSYGKEGNIAIFLEQEKLGIYNYYGGDEYSETRTGATCRVFDEGDCGDNGRIPELGTMSTYQYMYFAQLLFAERFQEPLSLEAWARGESSDLVDLKNINRVPVSIVHTLDDDRCSVEHSEFIFS